METGIPGAIWAVWLGILTSISPCPLATNIAAISYIGDGAGIRKTAARGLAYTAGRMAAYLALGILLVAGLLSSSSLSNFLQRHLNRILGPVLILTGMVLLFAGMVAFGSRSIGKVYERLRQAEHWGRRVTGTVFVLVGIYYSLVYIFEVI